MKKNILMILTDQHTFTTLSSYGHTICKSPNLDRLAKDSIIFDCAYTVCPICTPSRASIQTGLYPSKHGMITNIYTKGCMVHELPDNEQLLSRRLLAAGYSIGYTGKWHMGAGKNQSVLGGVEYPWIANQMAFSGLPSDVGYEGDDFAGHGGIGDSYVAFHSYLRNKGKRYEFKVTNQEYPHTAEIISGIETTVPHFLVDQAIEKILEFASRDRSFYYMINFWQPHEPYYVPTEILDQYRDLKLNPWETFWQNTGQLPMIHNVERSMNGDWDRIQEFVKYYYAAVTQIDFEIGRLIDAMKTADIYDDLVIVFSADHGETLGVHGGLTDKGLDMYEETIHIPLYMKVPGIGPRRQKELVQTCDLYSTILDLAGVDRSISERDGKSLMRIFEGEPWRDYVVSESSGLDFLSYTQRMIRDARYKFVFHVGEIDELYDLETDPYEKVNLVGDNAFSKRCIHMLGRLRDWLIANKDGLIIRYDNIMRAKIDRYQAMEKHEQGL